MTQTAPSAPVFTTALAQTAEDLRAAQRLRYRVFVEELGGAGAMVDHEARLEQDRFDPFFDHLLLRDITRPEAEQVVGVYRLLRSEGARAVGQFYSEDEYDLAVLRQSGRRLLELGRSCLLPEYRGGAGMFHLWTALSAYVAQHQIEILFGVASFHGTDRAALAAPLSLLYHAHLAPPELRVQARGAEALDMNMIAATDLDRRAAVLEIPALIKAYLRLGGFVGQGAYVDHAFNTTDVCLVLDTLRMNARQRSIYTRPGGA